MRGWFTFSQQETVCYEILLSLWILFVSRTNRGCCFGGLKHCGLNMNEYIPIVFKQDVNKTSQNTKASCYPLLYVWKLNWSRLTRPRSEAHYVPDMISMTAVSFKHLLASWRTFIFGAERRNTWGLSRSVLLREWKKSLVLSFKIMSQFKMASDTKPF